MNQREQFLARLVTLFRTAGLGEQESQEYAASAMQMFEREAARMVLEAEKRGMEIEAARVVMKSRGEVERLA